ncbi:MmgE/PrpD family protein [Natrinema sp. DC36]|uniref:MmgE/PrpD family protein n=1 Tax=Natrinema sp. DC36 TaxID=2878680 RepID=UPI001CF0227E|nr:MmgE/PrpD family protein [Natrinema sp. DC36]
MTAEASFASFVASLSPEDVPADVRDHVGLVVADTIGAIVGGSTTDPVASLRNRYADRYEGSATVLGTSTALPTHQAATLNGTAGTVLELDEGHKLAAGHPSIHVLPALLAVAETDDGDAEAFSTAFVAGYETAVRVARACQPLADGYHPHGVWGVVGAAAAIANYERLDEETTADALRIAANHAQHTRFEAAVEGSTVRDTYAGMVAPDAIAAVDQARSGFTGLEDGVRRHLARTSAGPIEFPSPLALGDRWAVTEGYFKIHAACRYTHPALDAVDALDAVEPLDVDAVDAVGVETYPAAAALADPEPRNRLAAKFSLPFAIATRLRTGHAGKDAFEPAALEDATYRLARRVSVEQTPEFESAVPDSRGARVIVTLEDGRERSETVERARGGAHRRFDEERLREKFRSLVAPSLGDAAAEDAWVTIRDCWSGETGSLCRAVSPSSNG